MVVSFDLFGTLVAVERPDEPADAVGRELRERGVAVPDDWVRAYREPQVAVDPGRETPLSDHVAAALASRDVDADEAVVEAAVRAAFDGAVETREGAEAAVDAAAAHGTVGVLSNCSVTGLVERALDRSTIDPERFDAVVASVDSGWRKPDPRAFEAVAAALETPTERLVHVGDDPATDGAASKAGATPILLSDVSLRDLPTELEAIRSR
ncbi:HAD family hydrolase [Halosimplex sp. TS25]|uniref:HAD family hydrolase n=1 Tax=Halosimplex rarum TaxID=3396619 RepID=UPI0039E94280